MGLVKFGDYVKEVKINIDRNNNPYEYYVAGDHMDSEDLTIRRKGLFATDDVGPAFTRLFKPGQILYGSRRTYLKKVAVADFEGICSNTTFVLETKDENKLRQRLLPFIMLTDDFTKWSISKSKGSTNPYILFSDLANYEFELPDINRQDELVNLLWQAYATKESYREMIRATDEMVKSQFIEMFGVLQDNTKGFPQKKLGEIAFVTKLAGFEYTKYVKYKPQGDIIMVRGLNCKQGKLILDDIYWIDKETSNFLNRSQLSKGDIVLTYVGTVGEVALIEEDNKYHLAPNVAKISLYNKTENNPEYWTYALLFSRDYVTHFAASTTQAAISMEKIRDILFPIPDYQRQCAFVPIVHQADKSKFELKQAIEKIDKVMRALMQ